MGQRHSCTLQVFREVAVFDNISRGIGYSARVKQLGLFLAAHPNQQRPAVDILLPRKPTASAAVLQPSYLQQARDASRDSSDIADPLYGNMGGREEREALRQCLRQLKLSCEGLVHFLQHLHDRWDAALACTTTL